MRPKNPQLDGKVLFVRVDASLLRKLDKLLRQQQAVEMGRRLSRSDLVRQILWERVTPRPGA